MSMASEKVDHAAYDRRAQEDLKAFLVSRGFDIAKLEGQLAGDAIMRKALETLLEDRSNRQPRIF